jgi:endothelin-converting enzyme
VAPLLEVLNETSTQFVSGDLSSTVLHALKSGQSSLIAAGTGADDKDPDTVVVSISAPWSVGLPAKEMYEDGKILKSYEKAISEVFSALKTHATMKGADAAALIEFEKQVAEATPSAEDRNDVTVSGHRAVTRVY